jgi:hypothetical protein
LFGEMTRHNLVILEQYSSRRRSDVNVAYKEGSQARPL